MADIPRRRTARPTNARRTTAKQRKSQHVLDVAVRVDQASRQRQRWFFGLLSKTILVVGLGAGLYYGGSMAAARLLFKNPEYNIAELNVETDGVLTPEVVVAASDLRRGANIFQVDLARAKARVEAIPQVEKAQVTRKMPRTISIQVTERKPIAWIASERDPASRDELAASGKSFLIDTHGVLLQPGKTLPQDYHLPIIRNYGASPLAAGNEAEGEEIKAALDLLHTHQDSLIASRFQIQEIDLSKHYGLNVLGESGVQVLFGLDDMDKQLKRLDTYLQTLEPQGQRPATINLLPQRNIPVTFITEPVAPPGIGPAGAPGVSASPPVAAATPGTSKKDSGSTKDKKKSKPREEDEEEPKHHARADKSSRSHSKTPTIRRALPVHSTH